MDDLTLSTVFDDNRIEILPPDRNACGNAMTCPCDCCGRHAVMDEDCCGICEECLAP